MKQITCAYQSVFIRWRRLAGESKSDQCVIHVERIPLFARNTLRLRFFKHVRTDHGIREILRFMLRKNSSDESVVQNLKSVYTWYLQDLVHMVESTISGTIHDWQLSFPECLLSAWLISTVEIHVQLDQNWNGLKVPEPHFLASLMSRQALS